MNRKLFGFTTVVFILAAIFLTSCRSNGPDGVDITGLWSGTLISNDYDTNGSVIVMEFSQDGTVRMGSPNTGTVYSEARSKDFTWSLDENYLTITSPIMFYHAEYAYDLSADGSALGLILIVRNFTNEMWEELTTGDTIFMVKNTTDDFSDLLDESFYY